MLSKINFLHTGYGFLNRFLLNKHKPIHLMLYNVIEPNKMLFSYLLSKIGTHKLLIAVILFLI